MLLVVAKKTIYGASSSLVRTSSENLLPRVSSNIELLPRHIHSKASTSSITQSQPLPIILNPITVGYADSGSGTVEGEADVVVGVDEGEVGEVTVVGGVLGDGYGVLELEVAGGVAEPALSETVVGGGLEGVIKYIIVLVVK